VRADPLDLASVKAHPHPERPDFAPRRVPETLLSRKGRGHRLPRRRKCRVHGVAQGLEDRARILLDGPAHDGVMLADGVTVGVGIALHQSRRSLHVREQEGHGS
jgi:hypothetical protein